MKYATKLATIVMLLTGLPASAAYITLEDDDRGWYRDTGFTELPNQNYLVGGCAGDGCGAPVAEYRKFFLFDISTVDRPITGARVLLWMPQDGFLSPTGNETFELFHVQTNLDELGQRWGEDIFDDLGSGTSYSAHV
jgi:hypothetical protein